MDQQRIKELMSMPYQEYLQTEEWAQKREQVLARDGHRCRLCDSSEKLHVHHRTYARRGNEDLDDLTTLCEQHHEQFHQRVKQEDSETSGLDHVRTMLAEFVKNLDAAQTGNHPIGPSTGFSDLDRLLGGLGHSDLVILAGRPSVGKSACALSMAHNLAVQAKKGVAVFSLEMSKEQLFQRLIAMDAGVDLQRLRTGWMDDEEWEWVMAAMDRLSDAPLYTDDTVGITTIDIQDKVRRVMSEGVDIQLVIVDYLQLMSPTIGKRYGNREQEIAEISRSLKGLARNLNVPVLALAQLSRAVEGRISKIPQLSDLRESGSIENDADVVMFIYREEIYNPETERRNIADIIVAKHRNGPVGEVSLYFKKSHTRFSNLEEPSANSEG
jgi:replicative DNA helicase